MPSVDYATNYDIAVYETTANTALEIDVPDGAKSVQIQCRDATDLILGETEVSVDGGSAPGPYFTIKASTVFRAGHLYLTSAKKLYVACASSSKYVEVLFFY